MLAERPSEQEGRPEERLPLLRNLRIASAMSLVVSKITQQFSTASKIFVAIVSVLTGDSPRHWGMAVPVPGAAPLGMPPDWPYPPDEVVPMLLITSGGSGRRLSINVSMGIVGFGGASGLAPVTSGPGFVMGILEFGGRNDAG